MDKSIRESLVKAGLSQDEAALLEQAALPYLNNSSPELAWQALSQELLLHYDFPIQLLFFTLIYPDWHAHPELAPAWIPTETIKRSANITQLMQELHCSDVKSFHSWTVNNPEKFWQKMLAKLHLVFSKPAEKICDLSLGVASPAWLKGAELNIVDSCFTAPHTQTALIFQDKNALHHLSYAKLNKLANRVANSLVALKFSPGDRIAIAMPMTVEAIAIYLGIIKMGGVVVSIADSFSSTEIATRLHIADARAIFTQDCIQRGNKTIPLYERVVAADAPMAIVIQQEDKSSLTRDTDHTWQQFLLSKDTFVSHVGDPMRACNILFSSGTTGDPKAIVWNHTTAIKVAADAFLHQNIQPGDILAWPTNLGWMMGPWLIFAALINQATIAVYPHLPTERAFGEFIQNAKVTMLGVIPTIVAAWRQSQCMKGLDWRSIKALSSTGECSNSEDMLYLMSLAGFKPVIEYCGGTEVGGSYISSTVVENNYPSLFTTPTMGLDFILLDEEGQPSDNGEVALIPPSIGLSTTLLNADHHKTYFANMPSPTGKTLRRHGDQIKRLSDHAYSVLGRADDTMNLGGIKISSAEIERALAGIESIRETAAIAITPAGNGPSHLVIFASTPELHLDKESYKKTMQSRINQYLNPLFKIYDVVFIKELPKTASNKIMRRVLRKSYMESTTQSEPRT